MQVDFRAVGGHFANLSWVAIRSFCGVLIGFVLAGLIFAGGSYFCLRTFYWPYPVGAALIALAEAIVAGVYLGGKHAMAAAMAQGLRKLRLGGSLVRATFDRMSIAATNAPDVSLGTIERGMARVPLGQAEAMLTSAVHSLIGDCADAGWLRRKLQTRMLEAVRKYTLAQFRHEGARQGGIDLTKVRDELEQSVDHVIAERLIHGTTVALWLAALILPALVALQTLLVYLWLQYQG